MAPNEAEIDRLYPGDVVAAQVPPNGTVARLLDGRGWLDLTQLGESLEEVEPWVPWADGLMLL